MVTEISNHPTLGQSLTREGYLMRAVDLMRPWFEACGKPLPRIHVSTGFGGPGMSGLKTLGVCWDAGASTDNSRHIFIAPHYNDTLRVLDVLLHECCHAALPDGVKHGPAFKRLATEMGLTGKMTATVATPELTARLDREIVSKIGRYPHPALNPNVRKKQSTRLVKVVCPQSGYVCRVTRKWIEELGTPLSPVTGEPMVVEEPKEGEGE